MWSCPSCHESIDDAFDACWNCGTSNDGIEDRNFRSREAASAEKPQRSAVSAAPMVQSERFSVKHGIEGCLVTVILNSMLMLSISLVLNVWLNLISSDTERTIGVFIWLFGIGVGGYVAARQGRSTGWSNSLVVGVPALLYVAARLPNGGPLQTYWAPFLEIMNDPGAHWRVLAAMVLSLPVAVLGGIAWQKTCS